MTVRIWLEAFLWCRGTFRPGEGRSAMLATSSRGLLRLCQPGNATGTISCRHKRTRQTGYADRFANFPCPTTFTIARTNEYGRAYFRWLGDRTFSPGPIFTKSRTVSSCSCQRRASHHLFPALSSVSPHVTPLIRSSINSEGGFGLAIHTARVHFQSINHNLQAPDTCFSTRGTGV
jgi:hypothetical protein